MRNKNLKTKVEVKPSRLQKSDKTNMLNKLRKIIGTSSIEILVGIPFCVGFLLLIGLLSFSIFFEIQDWLRDLTVNITFFVWGCSGAVIITRKESPPPWYEKGGMAVLHGILLVSASWGMNILYLFSLFR